ncbi:MAG TPA: class I SAM-dependent methyltransferase, partial [Candidatus Limnocylindria bacterium]|nr:class I SAM-dependent methyltransferase [Candidatus Limnocylindria bacterium]
MTEALRSARHVAQRAFEAVLRPGDTAVDATLGRGRDCLALCELVGPQGVVYGFDPHPDAVRQTEALLREHGMFSRARLFQMGHERMAEAAPPGIRLAAFNLGWLPGSDKALTTRAETTMIALQSALALLAPGGMASVCVYPGHAEGARERDALLAFARGLPNRAFTALWHDFLNAG